LSWRPTSAVRKGGDICWILGMRKERKFGKGGNEASRRRPLLDSAQARGARGVFGAKSALPRCETRFELLYRAGLRGCFGVS
jgi:hypothetical protein